MVTKVGRVLTARARAVLATASRFEAVVAGTRNGTEPELALAIDSLVPTARLIARLRTLHSSFPKIFQSVSRPSGWEVQNYEFAAARRRSRFAF